MEQCREVMRFRRLALRTEEAYLQWIKRFLVFYRDTLTSPRHSLLQGSGEESGRSGGVRRTWGSRRCGRF